MKLVAAPVPASHMFSLEQKLATSLHWAPDLVLQGTDKSSRLVCPQFGRFELCDRGLLCPLRHLQLSSLPSGKPPCRHWMRSLCMIGDELCPFPHVLQTISCRAYDAGFCLLGPACRFFHRKKSYRNIIWCGEFTRGFCNNGPSCWFQHHKVPSLADL